MKENPRTKIRIKHKGSIVVDEEYGAEIVARCKDVVAIDIHLDTKRGDIIGHGYANGIPSVYAEANECSCKEIGPKGSTEIELSEFAGFVIHCAGISKQIAHVCLVRDFHGLLRDF